MEQIKNPKIGDKVSFIYEGNYHLIKGEIIFIKSFFFFKEYIIKTESGFIFYKNHFTLFFKPNNND